MRCTQVIGLKADAYDWLEKECKRVSVEICPHCGHTKGGGIISEVYDRETGVKSGMFDDGPMLHEYTLKDESKVREIVQAAPWSSGPCIFLCLQKEDGERLFQWTEKEINFELGYDFEPMDEYDEEGEDDQ